MFVLTECDKNKVCELQDIMCEFVQMELQLKQFEEAVGQLKQQVGSTQVMPLFHQRTKPRSCRRPSIVDSR